MQKPVLFATLLLALLVLLSGASRAPAAPPAGTLSGVVLNSSGSPVGGAQVSLQAADGTGPRALHADARGHFRITNLRPGLYEVRAAAEGNWSAWKHNVLVRRDVQASVTLRLLRGQPRTTTPVPN